MSNMINEEEEVDVCYKVEFSIHAWDGTVRNHTADVAGNVCIKDLKMELEDELGEPTSTQWYLATNDTLMIDDYCIHPNYISDYDEVLHVIVRQRQPKVPEMRPVMESH